MVHFLVRVSRGWKVHVEGFHLWVELEDLSFGSVIECTVHWDLWISSCHKHYTVKSNLKLKIFLIFIINNKNLKMTWACHWYFNRKLIWIAIDYFFISLYLQIDLSDWQLRIANQLHSQYCTLDSSSKQLIINRNKMILMFTIWTNLSTNCDFYNCSVQ